MIVIPVVIGALGTDSKSFIKGMNEQEIWASLLKTNVILRRVLAYLCGHLVSSVSYISDW